MNTLQKAVALLGLKKQDQVTGFKGMVSSVCFDAYGCIQAVLTPEATPDGKVPDGHWYDVKRLVDTSEGEKRIFPAPDFTGVFGQENGPAEKPAR